MKPKHYSIRRPLPLAGALLVTLCCTAVNAANWDGSESTDWNNPLNWSGDAIPSGAPAGVGITSPNIATISADVVGTPTEIIIGGWFSTGRVDHVAGTLTTQTGAWPPGWVLIGFGPQGNATYNLADTAATGGAFTGFGTGTGSFDINDALFFGEPGGSTSGVGVGTMNVNTTGTVSVTYDINLGVSGWTGNMNLDSGTVTARNLYVGKTQNANATAGIGNFRMSGGSLTLVDRLTLGAGGEGVAVGANVGSATISGGTLRTDNLHDAFWAAGVNMASGVWNGVNGSGIGGSGGTATFNLDGGTLSTHWVFSENRVDNLGTPENTADDVTYAKGTSTFNFNGGTLQAQGAMEFGWLPFMGNLTNAFVKAGGAIIDTNGFNNLITQPLLGDPASSGGGLTKNGGGQLELTGQGTFTGPVVVNAGTLYANIGNGPTDRNFSFASEVTVNTGATLKAAPNSLFGWDGSQAKPLTVNAGAAAVAIESDQNVGLVTLNGGTLATEGTIGDWGSWNFGRAAQKKLLVTEDSTVTAWKVGFHNGASIEVLAGKTLSFMGTIADSNDGVSSIIKEGDGILRLELYSTYSGDTTIHAGSVSMVWDSLADASTVSIATGATLNLEYDSTDTVKYLLVGGVHQAPGLYRASDANGGSGDGIELAELTGIGKLLVTNTPPVGGYSTWADTNVGGATADVDTDLDGVSNGIEYFMDAAAGFTSNPAPNGSMTVTWPNGGNIPASEYGVQFVVQTSTDLTNWTDVPLANLAENTDGPGGLVSYTITGSGKQFVRLKVMPN